MVSVLDVCMYPTVSSDFAEHYYTEAIIVCVCVYMRVCVCARVHMHVRVFVKMTAYLMVTGSSVA